MRKMTLTLLLVLFSGVLWAQYGEIHISDKFYMNPVSDYPSISEKYKDAGYFLLRIKQDRTNQECVSGAYFDRGIKKYVFPLIPRWNNIAAYDTFTITIEYQGAARIVGFLGYAGLTNPTYTRNDFKTTVSASTLSGISKGIPMVSLSLSLR